MTFSLQNSTEVGHIIFVKLYSSGCIAARASSSRSERRLESASCREWEESKLLCTFLIGIIYVRDKPRYDQISQWNLRRLLTKRTLWQDSFKKLHNILGKARGDWQGALGTKGRNNNRNDTKLDKPSAMSRKTPYFRD